MENSKENMHFYIRAWKGNPNKMLFDDPRPVRLASHFGGKVKCSQLLHAMENGSKHQLDGPFGSFQSLALDRRQDFLILHCHES